MLEWENWLEPASASGRPLSLHLSIWREIEWLTSVRECAVFANEGTNRLYYEYSPRKLLISLAVVVLGHWMTDSTFLGSGAIPFPLTVWPRYLTSVLKSVHFFGESLSLAFHKHYKTWHRLAIWWEKVCPGTMISSRYTRVMAVGRPRRTCSINLLKVSRALQSLSGITLNCHRLFLVEKAVFSLAASSRGTCQYLLLRSCVENHFAPASTSMVSSIRGSGCGSLWVTLFNLC